jgi:Uma2 family endonuclease
MTANLKFRDDMIRESFLSDIPSEEEEFPYGWRRIAEIASGGSVRYHDIPLKPEDFLNPQEGDQMPQGPEHGRIAADIYIKIQKYYRNSPDTAVLFDVKMRWGIPGLKEPFPDICVIPGVRETDIAGASFDVKLYGTRPCLIVEVVSPRYIGDDTAKVDIYEQAGVQEYIIVNPHTENTNLPFELTGYRLVRGRYREIAPDSQGCLLSETTGLLFGSDQNRREIVVTGSVSGEILLSNKEEIIARENAEALAKQEAARAEQAEAELRRLKAEFARLKSDSGGLT